MSFIKNYKLLQAALLSLAVSGFGVAAYNTVSAGAAANADQTDVVAAEVADAPLADGAIVLSEDDGYPAPIGDEEEDEDGSEELEGDEEDREEDEDGSDEGSEELEEGEDDAFNQVLELIGVDEETLEEALSSGQTLAEIAEENGVDPQQVVDALVAAEEAYIAEELVAGEITEEEAAEIRQEAAEFIAFEISNRYPDPFKTAVDALGIDEEAFWEALDSGQSLDEIAAGAGADAQAVVDAVVQAETEYIDAMVAAGLIDAEERDEWVAELETEISEFLSEEFGGEGAEDNDSDEDSEEGSDEEGDGETEEEDED